MRWSRVRPRQAQGLLTCLEQAPSLDGFDPYLIWADLTVLRRSTDPARRLLPVSFEARLDAQGRPVLPSASLIALNQGTKKIGLAHNSRFFTGFVPAARLLDFAATVERFRVGLLPRPDGSTAVARSTPVTGRAGPHRSDQVVIGFIDHGIAFAQRQFAARRGGLWASRIERVWDQEAGLPGAATHPRSGGAHELWRAIPGFCYGRELVNLAPSAADPSARRQIDALMNGDVDEAAIYRRAGYRPAQGGVAHGVHVMSIAAGKTAYQHRAPARELADSAAAAAIIAVQLPNLPEKDTSGQSLHVNLLDAVSYILQHAAGRKLVINLSDGAYAGPHDGHSLLERALSTLLPAQARDRLLVVAAGNQFDERVHWAERLPAAASRTLDWRLLPEDRTDSHLEIWFEEGLAASALRGIELRLRPPGGGLSPVLKIGQTLVWHDEARQAAVRACATFAKNAPNAAGRRCMVHLAMAPTLAAREGPALSQTCHGVWQIQLNNRGANDLDFEAFIERDNPALGDRGPGRQSHFIHPAYPRDNRQQRPALGDEGNASPIRRTGALNIVATAANLVVVGGHVAATRRLAAYSASGPGRAGAISGVDLLAPSETSDLVHGVRAAAVRSGATFRMDGTSVAAPAVTRAAANLMTQAREVTDLQGRLRSLARSDVPGPLTRVGAGRLVD